MKYFFLVILLIFSLATYSFDHNVVKGAWAVYTDNPEGDDLYYFLKINDDFSGVLIRSLGHPPITNTFSGKDITFREGYLELKLTKYETAIFSAWVLPDDLGRLTGQVYMYNQEGNLFNMLYFPLDLLSSKHNLLKNDLINKLNNKYK